MPAFVKNAGTWKNVNKFFVKNGGTWRTISKAWVKSGGIWRQFYNSTPIPSTQLINTPNGRTYNIISTNGTNQMVAILSSPAGPVPIPVYGIYTSNGTSWTEMTVPNPTDQSSGYYSIKYGNGIYLACALDSALHIRSSDGINWSYCASVGGAFVTVGYGNGRFVISDYTAGGDYFTTNNGSSWTPIGTYTGPYGLVYGNNGVWLGSRAPVEYSTNLTTWNSTNLPYSYFTMPISYANNLFFVNMINSGSSVTDGLYYSSNGISFTKVTGNITPGPKSNVVFGSGVYACIDYFRKGILYSTNGTEWIFYTDANTPSIKNNDMFSDGLAFCPNIGFCAVGSVGKILRFTFS